MRFGRPTDSLSHRAEVVSIGSIAIAAVALAACGESQANRLGAVNPSAPATSITGKPTPVPTTPSTTIEAARPAVMTFVDAQTGWLVSNGHDRILATKDGGQTFSIESVASSTANPGLLVGLDFISATTGWALGSDSVSRTTDGGLTWAPVAQPRNDVLANVAFSTDSSGFGVTISGSVVYSGDGGAGWSTVSAPGPVLSLCSPAARQAYALTATTIYSTTNAGTSWSQVFSIPGSNGGGRGVSIACQGSTVWVTFDLGSGAGRELEAVITSSNGGAQWSELQASNQTYSFTQIASDPTSLGSPSVDRWSALTPTGTSGAVAVTSCFVQCSGPAISVMRLSSTGSVTSVPIPQTSTEIGANYAPIAFAAPTSDAMYVQAIAQPSSSAPSSIVLYSTQNAGATWSVSSVPTQG